MGSNDLVYVTITCSIYLQNNTIFTSQHSFSIYCVDMNLIGSNRYLFLNTEHGALRAVLHCNIEPIYSLFTRTCPETSSPGSTSATVSGVLSFSNTAAFITALFNRKFLSNFNETAMDVYRKQTKFTPRNYSGSVPRKVYCFALRS